MGPLLIVNMVVYLIMLGLAGWSLDKYIDGRHNHPRKFSPSKMNTNISIINLSCMYWYMEAIIAISIETALDGLNQWS